MELTFNADKLVLDLKVADSSYSSQYKHFYTFEFDSFGQVDVEMPQVQQASVTDILDEIIATDTYNLLSGNYPSVVENGQGAVYLPGEYNTTRLKRTAKNITRIRANTIRERNTNSPKICIKVCCPEAVTFTGNCSIVKIIRQTGTATRIRARILTERRSWTAIKS